DVREQLPGRQGLVRLPGLLERVQASGQGRQRGRKGGSVRGYGGALLSAGGGGVGGGGRTLQHPPPLVGGAAPRPRPQPGARATGGRPILRDALAARGLLRMRLRDAALRAAPQDEASRGMRMQQTPPHGEERRAAPRLEPWATSAKGEGGR